MPRTSKYPWRQLHTVKNCSYWEQAVFFFLTFSEGCAPGIERSEYQVTQVPLQRIQQSSQKIWKAGALSNHTSTDLHNKQRHLRVCMMYIQCMCQSESRGDFLGIFIFFDTVFVDWIYLHYFLILMRNFTDVQRVRCESIPDSSG